MNLHSVELIGLAIVAIVFVTYRQSRWTSVRLNRLLRMPLIFAVAGVLLLVTSIQQVAHWHLGVADVAIIATELVLGLAGGWLMGRLTQIRTVGGEVKSRLGKAGIAVWLAFIAVRIALGATAVTVHATIAEQQATIFLVLALVKTVQALIIRQRVDRHHAEESVRAYATSSL